jgi:hypothetical protein
MDRPSKSPPRGRARPPIRSSRRGVWRGRAPVFRAHGQPGPRCPARAGAVVSWPCLSRALSSARSRCANRRSGQERRSLTGDVSNDTITAVIADVDLRMNNPGPVRGKCLPSGRIVSANRTCGRRNRSVFLRITPAAIGDRQLGSCRTTIPAVGPGRHRRVRARPRRIERAGSAGVSWRGDRDASRRRPAPDGTRPGRGASPSPTDLAGHRRRRPVVRVPRVAREAPSRARCPDP